MQLLPLASFAATAVAIAIGMSGVERVALVAGKGACCLLSYQEQVIGRWQMLIARGGEVLSKRNEKWVAIESVTSSRE